MMLARLGVYFLDDTMGSTDVILFTYMRACKL
jgi:hypothetical protein